MARITKRALIEEFYEVFAEYSELSSKLLERVESGDIKYGVYLIYGLPYNYHSNWYLDGHTHGWKREETKVWSFNYHLQGMKEDLEELKTHLAVFGDVQK